MKKEGEKMQKPCEGKVTIEMITAPEWLAYICYLYRDENLTDEEVANRLKISRKTLHNWRKKSDKLNNAIMLGKQITDQQVENALYKAALEGNVTAMIFWLKNRKPNKWNVPDRIEQTNNDVVVIKDDI